MFQDPPQLHGFPVVSDLPGPAGRPSTPPAPSFRSLLIKPQPIVIASTQATAHKQSKATAVEDVDDDSSDSSQSGTQMWAQRTPAHRRKPTHRQLRAGMPTETDDACDDGWDAMIGSTVQPALETAGTTLTVPQAVDTLAHTHRITEQHPGNARKCLLGDRHGEAPTTTVPLRRRRRLMATKLTTLKKRRARKLALDRDTKNTPESSLNLLNSVPSSLQ